MTTQYDPAAAVSSLRGAQVAPITKDEEDGLATPLISQGKEKANDGDADISREASVANSYFFTAVTALLVAGGVAASIVAIVTVQTVIIYVACGICLINSPWVAVNQYRIVTSSGIRKAMNKMRGSAVLLQAWGKTLNATVADLQEEVDCLRDVEKELDLIAKEQGLSIEEIVSLVNENESVLASLKELPAQSSAIQQRMIQCRCDPTSSSNQSTSQDHLRRLSMSDITKIVLSSDKNGDTFINLKELNILTLRIRLNLEVYGVDLDEEKFMAMVRKDNDINHVLKVIAAILFKDKIDERDLGDYAEEALQESARQDQLVGSLLTAGSMLGRIRRLAKEAEVEDDDDAEMFTLDERYTRGSVDVARGTRITLARGTGGPTRINRVMRDTIDRLESNDVLTRSGGVQNLSESRD
ncbi:LOW QUALITY PROTEIN: hypothetical protein ACHAWF_010110 [Thalassiosira exigua]